MTTIEHQADARAIARLLVDERLAACVQVIPIQSHYEWDGALRESDEMLLLIKTLDARRVAERLSAVHPYEVPEIVTLTPEAVNEPYLAWMRDQENG